MTTSEPQGGLMREHAISWFRERHSLRAEAAGIALLYVLYETARGLVAGDAGGAVHHARMIASLERSLHLFVETDVQHAAVRLGLVGTLGVLYLTLHLAMTGACLVWLHRRHPAAFAEMRTALVVGSALALVGYVAFPTAPPRLAHLGIADTISHGHVDLNHGLVSSLYNPFAAVPSAHITYAVIVGLSIVQFAPRRVFRLLGALYPVLVLIVIVATGNHFLFDAAAGFAVALVALAVARTDRGHARPARVRLTAPLEA